MYKKLNNITSISQTCIKPQTTNVNTGYLYL